MKLSKAALAFVTFIFILPTHVSADCSVWMNTQTIMLGPDSFDVSAYDPAVDSVIYHDTICRSQFFPEMLAKYDSSLYCLIGQIDTVKRYSVLEKNIWRYFDSIHVSVDTTIKGQPLNSFWATDSDQVFYCTPSPDSACILYTSEDYKRYDEIMNKPFLMFADSLNCLRKTSVRPWRCRGDEGNYIKGDSLFSDYPYMYPQIGISLRQFLEAVNNHSSVRHRVIKPGDRIVSLETPQKVYDIRGRFIGISEKGKLPGKCRAGIYVFNSGGEKKITFTAETRRR
jgi:hypothetical protein